MDNNVEELQIENQAPKPSKKKKRTRVIWICAVCAAVAAVIIVGTIIGGRKAGVLTIAYSDTSVLEYLDFSNSVSATGTVESNDKNYIYSTQSYKISDVCVEVGDRVGADTLLCTLDSTSIQEQIESKELALSVQDASSQQNVKAASDSYSAAKSAVDNGENASLISANSGVRTAYESWQKTQKQYDDYAGAMGAGLNSNLIAQDSSVDNAQRSLANAQNEYNKAQSEADSALSALNSHSAYAANQKATNDAAYAAKQQEYDSAQATAAAALLERDSAQSAINSISQEQDAYLAANPGIDVSTDAAYLAIEARKTQAQADYAAKNEAYTQAAGAAATLQAALNTLSTENAMAESQNKSQYDSLLTTYQVCVKSVDSVRSSVDAAQSSYSAALRSRDAAYLSADNTLADYAKNVDTAYAAYQAAIDSYNATVASVEASLTSSYNSLKSAQLGADHSTSELDIERLRADINDTSIYAGVEGTVTAVYATVGATGSGLLFVIEDTDDLIVETAIKEYDIGSVSTGMPVVIKSDATGDSKYDGQIKSIAPASNKNAQGDTNTTGDVEFATKVAVTSQSTPLRIGMNVRLNLIIDQRSDVLCVPYDAVYKNGNGQTCVIVISEQSSGGYKLQELPVVTGLENDFDIIISGDGVVPGLRVLSDPTDYIDLIGASVQLGASANNMMFMRGN